MRRRMRKGMRGSYTVEAALLMGILLPLLVAVIYMGFYLHDRAFLQGAAHEAAVYASLHADDKSADVAGAAQSLVGGRMLGTRGAAADLSADEKRVDVRYHGSFQAPGISGAFLGQAQVQAGVSLTLLRPSRRIQMIRGVAKIIDSVRRIRT